MRSQSLKKKYVKLSLISLGFLLSISCSGIKIKDDPVCVELAPDKANCVRIVSGENFDVDEQHPFEGKTWWEMRNDVIAVPTKTWVNLKILLVTICKKTNQCQQEIKNWERSVNIIDNQINSKGP